MGLVGFHWGLFAVLGSVLADIPVSGPSDLGNEAGFWSWRMGLSSHALQEARDSVGHWALHPGASLLN